MKHKSIFVRSIQKRSTQEQELINDDRADTNVDERQTTEKLRKLRWKTLPATDGMKLYHRYLPTSRLLIGNLEDPQWYGKSLSERSTMSEEQIDVLFASTIRYLWTRYSSRLLSEIRKAQDVGMASILHAVLAPSTDSLKGNKTELETNQAYQRMKKFTSRQGSVSFFPNENDFTTRYNNDVILRRVVLDIDKTERQIENISAPRNRLEEMVKSLFEGGKVVKLRDQSIDIISKLGSEINISSLSSGEKHILRLLLETVLAEENSIIIDEPELSLHIDWQRRLVGMMQTISPDAQLILATHSPEVMADIPDRYIIQI